MSERLGSLKRSCMCAEVATEDIGRKITVMGWVAKRRDLGGLIFIDLRDRSGILQVVFNSSIVGEETFKKAETLRSEYVVAVTGRISHRADEAINLKIKTGKVEMFAEELTILSKSEVPPIYVDDDSQTNDALRLKYRYLDLRRPKMQSNLMLRHRAAKIAREYFDEQGFLEIETPTLTRSTPEGARDYLVPSRVHPGKFFALPQSPQLFKQLLMVSGFDRYMQIVKCFRDEDLRADRQPEFTQIDVEMSFVDVDDIISINEEFLKRLFKELKGIDIKLPLPRMTYKEAMDRFGSDKPDTRFGLELTDISAIVSESEFKIFADAVKNGGSVRGVNAKQGGSEFSRRDIDALGEFVKTYKAKGMAWIVVEEDGVKSPIAKFLKEQEMEDILKSMDAEPGDLICIIADKNEVVYSALGQLRLEIARRMELIDKDRYNLLWVTEFPLLEYSEEEQRYVAVHHPFTSPIDEDIELLETEPEKVRAKAYDIIINGMEIGGGSIRIHSPELQSKIFKALGFTQEEAWERFGFLLEAFKYGTPPHGGIAYGFDRIILLLADLDSIRDVIAFPKVQNSSCLMTEAPAEVEPIQLKELHINTDLE